MHVMVSVLYERVKGFCLLEKGTFYILSSPRVMSGK